MKHKISVGLLSAAFVFGLLSAGFVGTRAAVPTKADDPSGVTLYLTPNSDWTTSSPRYALYYYLDTTTNGWVDMTLVNGETNVYKATVPQTSGVVYSNVIFARMNPATTENNWTNKWNQTSDLTYAASTGNLYTITGTGYDKPTGSWSSYTEPTTYSVSEYAVVNGTAEATAFATETAGSTKAFTPTDVARTGFLLEGWYSDPACATKYVSKIWDAAGSLYAKYTTVSARAVYFKTAGWADTYVYTFGGDSEYGAWPGTKLTAANVTAGVAYEGEYGIVKVALTKNDTKVIFSNGTGGAKGTTQTYDLSIVNGAYYWVDADNGSTGDADKGSGAKVVYDINEARRAVTAVGTILEGSICGISKATAQNLVDEYDALNATAKSYVDAATDYTYDSTNTANSTKVSFTGIVEQLRIIANKSSTPAATAGIDNSAIAPAWIAIISIGIAAVASAGLWISRRKHE
jgi:hypothetical protein